MINASNAKTNASGNQRCDQSASATPSDSSLPARDSVLLSVSTFMALLSSHERLHFYARAGIRSVAVNVLGRITIMFARKKPMLALAVLVCCAAAMAQQAAPLTAVPPKEGDFVAQNFTFGDGESLPEIRMHYTTIGTPQRDANGHVTNAVLVLHGTNRKGGVFLVPSFAGVLFGPGQLLDTSKYYVILPDQLGGGAGKSTKP